MSLVIYGIKTEQWNYFIFAADNQRPPLDRQRLNKQQRGVIKPHPKANDKLEETYGSRLGWPNSRSGQTANGRLASGTTRRRQLHSKTCLRTSLGQLQRLVSHGRENDSEESQYISCRCRQNSSTTYAS